MKFKQQHVILLVGISSLILTLLARALEQTCRPLPSSLSHLELFSILLVENKFVQRLNLVRTFLVIYLGY